MKKLSVKSNYYTIVVFTVLFSLMFVTTANSLFAKGKQMERIKTMKKIRLLEILKLDANTSDKFLVKYNEYETKIEKKMEEIRANLKELKNILEESNKTNPVIKEKVNSLNKLQAELHNTILDRDKEMKTVLDEYTYAKYLVFEMGFKDKIVEKMMEKRGKNVDKSNKEKHNRKGWD